MRLLLTGSTGGIGSALCAEARARGVDVVTLDRATFDSDSRLIGLVENVSRGSIDSLVFATGVCPVKPLALMTDEVFAETFRVNCGLFLRVMRTLVAEKLYNPAGCRVMAISSVSATEGWPGGAAYCASKGALSALCRALDAELAPKKIRVKAIEPRYVKTKMFDACAGRMGVSATEARLPEDLAKEILEWVECDENR